ncbi:MAG: serine hydrolase [Parasphingorhabdus sp.]|uniref:serine hydrolase domain-containing protein n=1 Tax=Parasphingorhabdus sp. TaxID=2709688 RepID=UPI003297D5DD
MMNLKSYFVAISLMTAGCATMAEKPAAGLDEEALYMERYAAQTRAATIGGGLPSYDPLEQVRGASKQEALPIAETPQIASEALDKAEAFAATRNSSAFLVWDRGAIAREAYFDGYSATKLVNAKSLAKPLTAIIVGRAIQQGYIKSLDQPVADFITEWKNDAQRSQILVRHLLDMRTGLLPQGPAKGPEDVLNKAYLHPRHDEIIINEYPLVNSPGSRYEYANANSELVAPVIERATGKRYGQYLTEALLEPLGAAGGTIWVNRPGGTAHSGCCIQLPALTYLRFGILLAQDGTWNGAQLLPEGYVKSMTTATQENPHAGLGVWIAGEYIKRRGSLNPSLKFGQTVHSQPYAAQDLFLFDGNGNQVVYVIPSQQLVILRTGGRPPADSPWDNSYLPNLIINAMVRSANDPMPVPQKGR